MELKHVVLTTFLALCAAAAGQAGTITWNFDNPTGNSGSSGTSYTGSDGVTQIVAFGLVCTGGTPTAPTNCGPGSLYGKNTGTGEQGLGIAGETGNEINPLSFVQLNLATVLALNPTDLMVTIDSVQSGETFTLWAAKRSNLFDHLLDTGTSSPGDIVTVDLGNPAGVFSNASNGDNILELGATTGNVLLSSLTATVGTPEPATFALVGGALIGLASLRRRSKGRR